MGSFFPEKTRPADYLHEYSRRLTTVEGNTTFYAVPSTVPVEGWAAETPETFRFCPKLPRTISHAGVLVEHIDEALRFVDVMSGLGERLGPMFLQLPPRYLPALLCAHRLWQGITANQGDCWLAVFACLPPKAGSSSALLGRLMEAGWCLLEGQRKVDPVELHSIRFTAGVG